MVDKTRDRSTNDGKYIITTPIVVKDFIKKDGNTIEYKEYYLRRSIQDYYIKFCESRITREELTDYLSNIKGEIKTATLEVEFRDGHWDVCDGNDKNQSRTGEYVIVHRII